MFVRREAGHTVIELLVGLLLVSMLVAGAFDVFRRSTAFAHDNEIVSRAENEARTVLDMISYDLRMLGAGMPIGQSDFAPGGTGLGDSPLAILLSSDEGSVTFRQNSRGRDAIITVDYTPLMTNLTISVDDTSDFSENDVVYLSNMLTGGSEGMQAELNAVTSSTVTVRVTYVASPGATFLAGSTISRVAEVTYEEDAVLDEIVRIDQSGDVTVASDASLTFEYLDSSGTALTLPLTDSVVADSLSAIVITAGVDGKQTLSAGDIYTAVATQKVALRNLNLAR